MDLQARKGFLGPEEISWASKGRVLEFVDECQRLRRRASASYILC